MYAELIYNAHAGRSVVRRALGFVIEYLERNGWTLSVHEPRAPLEATELARQAAMNGADVIIAVGGDGTVNEVASGLVHTDAALGVIPVGTTNVWALQTRIPALSPIGPSSGLARLMADLEERMEHPLPLSYYRSVLLDAARVLVTGKTCTVDVGQANDRFFLLWAGIGLDAAVTVNVKPEDKKAFGPLAFVGTALDMIRDYKSTNVKITLDGQVKQVDTSLIIVSNIQLYGGILPLGARACINDGKLDVCVFKGEGLLNFVQHILKVASRQHLYDPEVEYAQVKEIIVESAQPLPVHVDDEPFTETPVTIRVLPKALRVIVPQDVPSELFVNQSPR
jgi:diacylglycerol kinase family enzyme